MKQLMRIVFIATSFFSSVVSADKVLPGTYDNLKAEERGKVGRLLMHPKENNTFLFSLKLNRGKPSYNSGHIFGELIFVDNVANFQSADFKFKEKICKLEFKNVDNVISVSSIDNNNQCGFGFGVYADGEYSLTSKDIPESYIDTLGNTVKFQ